MASASLIFNDRCGNGELFMIGILRIQDLQRELNWYFNKLPEQNRIPRIAGIVFSQPASILDPNEHLQLIEYYNFRSGSHVNFYFAGYERSTGPEKAWLYSPDDFNKSRQEMQEVCSKWRYSGDLCLILFNVKYDAKTKCAIIDYENGEPIEFEKIKPDVTLPTIGKIFERIFQYCEDYYNQSQKVSVSAAADVGSAKHLKDTLANQFVPVLTAFQNATDQLDALLAESIPKFTALNSATLANITKAKAVAEQVEKVMSPYGDMYKNPRLVDSKSEAIRARIPELVVDTIVRQMHTTKFPTTDWLLKHLYAAGLMKKLKAGGFGTSRSTVGRWHGDFRKILFRHGLVDEYRGRSFATRIKPSKSSGIHSNEKDDLLQAEKTEMTQCDTRPQELAEGSENSD